jgi:hypothetical protein
LNGVASVGWAEWDAASTISYNDTICKLKLERGRSRVFVWLIRTSMTLIKERASLKFGGEINCSANLASSKPLSGSMVVRFTLQGGI